MRASQLMILFGAFCLCLFSACNKPFANVSQSFETGCWPMQDTLSLEFDNTDTNQVYSLWFPVTVNEDYGFNNLHLRAQLVPPSGQTVLLPARFALMNESGEWLAEKSGSEVPFDLLMSGGLRFNQVGKYGVRLYHYMRDSSLCGVVSAGISIDLAAETASAAQ